MYGWVARRATSAAAPDMTSPLAAIHRRQATLSTSSSPKLNASPGLENAYIRCAAMTVKTSGATENFVARPRPTIRPASNESSLRPDCATRIEKNTPPTMNNVITPSTAKKWLNWM